jgi:hypothetical protein
MSVRPDSEEKLERLVQELLVNAPLRRAPASIEAAVLAEVARRAALPWWRLSFTRWPATARVVFVLISIALIALSILASGVREFGITPLAWAHAVVNAAGAASGIAAVFVGIIPSLWLYVGLMVGALLYALLFGLGAFAYRFLYLAPHGRSSL